ncbi:MAG: crossover junction endodeoxyribonuclease RuvC [Coriobacteriia bacterium]|nr:crossover junction endodeoxyribonuclease RuvC [Coriobacteriia bacterium]
MIILGIDPGLANTGWGIIETRKGQYRAHAYGCIQTSKDTDLAWRLKQIYDDINQIIEKYQPQEVAIEKIFFGENAKSAMATGQARGAALVATAGCGLKTGEYTPLQIKQAVAGHGRAEKQQVQFMVQSLLKLDHIPQPDHCADALAAAITHAHLSRYHQIERDYKSLKIQLRG